MVQCTKLLLPPSTPMRTLHRFCLPFVAVALLLTTVRTTAQETFAPLLAETTFSFVHVDFSNVDVDAVKTETKKLAEKFLTSLAFDARSQRATLRDLDIDLEKLDELLRPTFERLTKELGITEFATIMDESLQAQGIEFVIVVPWKGKTAEDLREFTAMLPDDFFVFQFPVGDFLFAVDYGGWDMEATEQEILTEWMKKAAASKDTSVQQALKSLRQSDEIKVFWKIPEAAKQEMQNMPLPEEMPIEVQKLVHFAMDKTEWIAASLPISELLSGVEMKDRRLLMVKVSSEADAKTYRELLEGAIDSGLSFAQLQAEKNETGVPPLLFEFMKGYLRTWLPDVEGDSLIFKWKAARGANAKSMPFNWLDVPNNDR